jgi:CRP/FNR family transcriptional regulator, cyclic AMP receptor protein
MGLYRDAFGDQAVRELSVQVLELEPELGLRVPAEQIAQARAELVAKVERLERGLWEPPNPGGGRLGFLMLEGLVARNLILAGTTCTELVGEGDVLQPELTPRDDNLVPYHVQWQVLEPCSVAILDDAFARLLGRWPSVMTSLLDRAVRRTLRMSIHQALLQLSPLETRLLILFWHLAERWGKVTPAGINVRLRLSHEVLGHLVGAQRASVTTALRHLGEAGRLARRTDGTWLLWGSPPDELDRVRWDHPSNGSARVGYPAAGNQYA